MTVDSPRIEVFQNLSITSSSSAVDTSLLRDNLIKSVRPPWYHDPEKEICNNQVTPTTDYIAFRRDAVGDGSAILVILHRLHSDRQYDLVNIVPTELNSLGISGYNDALTDFENQIVESANDDCAIDVQTTKRYLSITDWMTKEAVEALRSFSGLANMSTVASHPADAARWRRFVIADFRSPRRMDSSLFKRWLVEIEGWPPDEALELSADRDKGLELLDDFVQGM